jgi:hypothetical protein
MSCLADPRIEALQEHADANGELSFPAGPDCFRINLRDENIELWQETFEQIISPANLLLACADNEGDLFDTTLTWVVGSAIRGTSIGSATEAQQLLKAMGLSKERDANRDRALSRLGGKPCLGFLPRAAWWTHCHSRLVLSDLIKADAE